MKTHVIFFHGGGSVEDFEADQKLVESLKTELGNSYRIGYPFLPNDGSPDFGRRKQIREAISDGDGHLILVGHSLGASMLLACLSETTIHKSIAGVFLLATPFWQGNEDWVQTLKLQPDFVEKLDKQIPLFFYHCRDDEEVSPDHFEIYKRKLPWASFRDISVGGHQFTDGLQLVAEDVKSLEMGSDTPS